MRGVQHMKQTDNTLPRQLLFNRQWFLGRDEPKIIFKWQKIPLSKGFSIYAHVNLKVSITKTAHNSGLVVLGTAFYPETPERSPLHSLIHQIHDLHNFEEGLTNIAGSYCIINFTEERITLYNDAAGFMGIYYSDKVASSSPSLFSPLTRDSKIDQGFNFKTGNDWYTGSITPYLGIKKLIPNCSFNLLSGKRKRFWPQKHHFSSIDQLETELLIKKIAHLLQDMMVGILSHGKIRASITGGQDSRVVLAASKAIRNQISYFTLKGPTIQKNDIAYSKLLADQLGLSHQFYTIKSSAGWLLKLYDDICAGESIGARREIASTCLQFAGPDVIHVNGNLGAICKSYYWDNKNPTTFKTSAVLRDFVAPGQIALDGVEEWRMTVPDLNAQVLYNLFYLEQRGGRWMAAGENSSGLFYESFSPFNHRKLFTYICSLPIDVQYGGDILKLLVKDMAPELLSVPYCQARRNWSKFIPEKIKAKIRKIIK
jgi:hypothetical protein